MADRIRLYKFVTPPKEADGAQMTVGKKTFTTTGFVPTVKAINSLGATVNSIGLGLEEESGSTSTNNGGPETCCCPPSRSTKRSSDRSRRSRCRQCNQKHHWFCYGFYGLLVEIPQESVNLWYWTSYLRKRIERR